MTTELLSLFVGLCFGLVCRLFKLPIPCPPTLAGILAIVGVFIGYALSTRVLK